METTMNYEENVNANMFAVRALAFALLECRSESEALLVIKYFAKSKQGAAAPPESVCGPDGFSSDTD
jgi:hypothetical protein